MRSTLGRFLVSASVAVVLPACGGSREAPLTADLPLHLEDHLDVAVVTGSEVPANPPSAVEWRFDTPQPDWKVTQPVTPGSDPARLEQVSDALRVTASARGDRQPNGVLNPVIYVDLPDWRREDWLDVVVRARTTSVTQMTVGLGTWEGEVTPPGTRRTMRRGGITPVVSDGTEQTYRIRPDWGGQGTVGSWRRLGLGFFTREPGSIDILSVSVVPVGALYAADGVAVQSVPVGHVLRRTLVTHAPGRLAYRVRVPSGGRLDAALGVLGDTSPVEFRIVAKRRGGETTPLLRETLADATRWAERSIDLSRFAGQTITLALETDSGKPGTVAFWGAPTVSGVRATDKPNVIFYIIDGAGADYMSVYGYNRRTTPHLERIAAEGAVFERAWSNADWTVPSTPSFLTSLQSSVLGGLREHGHPVPDNFLTLAEHLHRAGYQTTGLTFNPNAGRRSNLDRGHDVFREERPPRAADYSISSAYHHADYWQWRTAYPGEPYYVHFQTTDVHADHYPVPPFAGLYLSADRRHMLDTWNQRIRAEAGAPEGGIFGVIGRLNRAARERTGIEWMDYWTAQRDLHDETMAHQDYQLGQLVARLKAQGEWERTLLIVAADHGISAGARDYGIAMRGNRSEDEEREEQPMFAAGKGHIPMIVVWPGRIDPGRRFSEPVSMIDLLPTILDLADLPLPEVMQGQSLVPLLLGRPGWEPRPVIFESVDGDGTGRFWGRIEVADGRWGASLQIPTPPGQQRYSWGARRGPALRLYDLWSDPMCLESLHEERPDLVEKYTKFLEDQFAAHQTLAKQFTPGAKTALTPEQLERLRALGYIR